MATKTILVIGGEQTSAYGLQPGQGFVAQFIRYAEQAGNRLQIEQHCPIDVHTALAVIRGLSLSRYDLILVQLGDEWLQRTVPVKRFWPRQLIDRLLTPFWLLGIQLVAPLNGVRQLRALVSYLTAILTFLKPHRHNVILLTPLPHQDSVSHLLRKHGRFIFEELAYQAGFNLFDTHSVIGRGDEYFLPGQPGQLSAVSHALLGRYLYDFYQAEPIVQDFTDVYPKPKYPRL